MNRKGEVEFWVKSSTKRKKSARQPYYHPSSKQKLNTNKNPSDNPSPSLPKSVIYNPIHENPTAKRHYLTILARKRWLQSTLRAKLPPHRITLALSTPIQFRRHTHPLPHTSSPASASKIRLANEITDRPFGSEDQSHPPCLGAIRAGLLRWEAVTAMTSQVGNFSNCLFTSSASIYAVEPHCGW